MRKIVRGAAVALLALAGAARAERGCFISYTGFEEKIPHPDLDTCPGRQVTAEEGFCRIALRGRTVLVYLFRHGEGEPCLAAVDRYAFSEFVARFGLTYAKP